MKIEVTHASIVNDVGIVAANVELVDEVTVRVDVRQVVGWNDWIDVYECVKRVMLMMEVKND